MNVTIFALGSRGDVQPGVALGVALQQAMNNRDPQATAELVMAALAQSQQRGILLTGWGGLSVADLPEHIYVLERVPHDWLFPRCAAVVHHGGAGTTAAALRSGVPSIVVPFFADQPFWANRVAKAGVGPTPVPRGKLTASNLAQAISQAVTDKAMQQKAAALAAAIEAEQGTQQAVALVEKCIVNYNR